jgi:septal ring factor EnvC (AmiA/AmiB activator)
VAELRQTVAELGQTVAELGQTEAKLQQTEAELDQVKAEVDRTEAILRLNSEQYAQEVNRFHEEEHRLRLICDERLGMINRLKSLPGLGLALRGRRRLKKAILAFKSKAAG